jgi:hypothetical protein
MKYDYSIDLLWKARNDLACDLEMARPRRVKLTNKNEYIKSLKDRIRELNQTMNILRKEG